MSRHRARVGGIVTLSAAAVLLGATPVSAQTGTFQATPTSGPPGTAISVSSVTPCVLPIGETGAPFARVGLSQGSTVVASGNFPASSSGAWRGTLAIGARDTPGVATLGGDCIAGPQAEGSLLHYQGVPFTVTASIPISGATTTPTGMPWSGSRPYEAGVAALGLVLIGMGSLKMRRARSARP